MIPYEQRGGPAPPRRRAPGKEEGRNVGSLLLNNPWVRVYLLYVAVLSVAFVWDRLRQPGRPGRRQKNPQSVSKEEQ
jgi:hypothetical protein